MSNRVQLGWRVPTAVWEAFESHVAEKDGRGDVYLQIRMKDAMEEFIEEDTDRADAAEALRHHRELHGLSSSSRSFSTDRYHGKDTKKVQHRIDPDLKASFQAFADKHDASSYGRMLASALDFWMDGGFENILVDGVQQLTVGGESGTNSGTTGDSDESTSSSRAQRGTTPAADESGLSSTTERGTTTGTSNAEDSVTVEPQLVLDAVNELPPMEALVDQPLPESELRKAVTRGVEPTSEAEIEAYEEAVCEQTDLEKHPHKEDVYVTEAFRESRRIYKYMDRTEATYATRRFAALEIVERGLLKGGVTYTDIQRLFEDNACGGAPSHDHAYTLMELAGEQDGFEYGEFRGEKKLRVDLSEVPDGVLEWLADEGYTADLDKLGVNARLEDYAVGSPPTQDQEAMTDD